MRVIDPAIYIAKAAQQELNLLRLKAGRGKGNTEFFVSACPEQFAHQTQRLMNFYPVVQQVDLNMVNRIPFGVLGQFFSFP